MAEEPHQEEGLFEQLVKRGYGVEKKTVTNPETGEKREYLVVEADGILPIGGELKAKGNNGEIVKKMGIRLETVNEALKLVFGATVTDVDALRDLKRMITIVINNAEEKHPEGYV